MSPPTEGVDGPLTASMCQNGDRQRSPVTGAIHGRGGLLRVDDAITNGQSDGRYFVTCAKLSACCLGVMIDGSLGDSENCSNIAS